MTTDDWSRDALAAFPWLADLDDGQFARFRDASAGASSRQATMAHLNLHAAHPVVIGTRDAVAELRWAPAELHQRWHELFGAAVPADLVRDDPRLTRLVQDLRDELMDFSFGERGPQRLAAALTTVLRPPDRHVCLTAPDTGWEVLLTSPGPITQVTTGGAWVVSTPPGQPLPASTTNLWRQP